MLYNVTTLNDSPLGLPVYLQGYRPCRARDRFGSKLEKEFRRNVLRVKLIIGSKLLAVECVVKGQCR